MFYWINLLKGTLTSVDGEKYVGNWLKDKKSGYGVLTFSGGDVYQGTFKDDKMSGQGIYTWKDGA